MLNASLCNDSGIPTSAWVRSACGRGGIVSPWKWNSSRNGAALAPNPATETAYERFSHGRASGCSCAGIVGVQQERRHGSAARCARSCREYAGPGRAAAGDHRRRPCGNQPRASVGIDCRKRNEPAALGKAEARVVVAGLGRSAAARMRDCHRPVRDCNRRMRKAAGRGFRSRRGIGGTRATVPVASRFRRGRPAPVAVADPGCWFPAAGVPA